MRRRAGSAVWRWLKRLAVLLVVAFGIIWATLTPGDPDLFPGGEDGIAVHVVDHGYHTGIVLGASDLRRAAIVVGETDKAAAGRLGWLSTRFTQADWIELGWGDAAFYQATPGIGDVQIGLGLEALFVPTEAVLQVVPGWGAAEAAFPASDKIRLVLGPDGFARLATALAATIPEPVPQADLGPSLYGDGQFFPAELEYHLFRTCNHWVSWLLREAGVPSSSVPGTFSTTLMMELRWRVPGR